MCCNSLSISLCLSLSPPSLLPPPSPLPPPPSLPLPPSPSLPPPSPSLPPLPPPSLPPSLPLSPSLPPSLPLSLSLFRDQLIKTQRQLYLRQRTLISELSQTFCIQQMNDTFTICDVILPNGDPLESGKD